MKNFIIFREIMMEGMNINGIIEVNYIENLYRKEEYLS